jgi:hypothetical protein
MRLNVLTIAGLALTIISAPAFAHHPFDAEYDWKKPVTITGTVTRFDWTNPHSSLAVDAKDANGKVTKWTFELGSPGELTGLGWTRNQFKIGDQVSLEGWQAKNGTPSASLKSVKLASGKELYGGSSFFQTQHESTAPDSAKPRATRGQAVPAPAR